MGVGGRETAARWQRGFDGFDLGQLGWVSSGEMMEILWDRRQDRPRMTDETM